MRYTWAQFTGYLRQARRRATQTRIERLVDTNVAFAGGEAAVKLHRGLADQAKRLTRED